MLENSLLSDLLLKRCFYFKRGKCFIKEGVFKEFLELPTLSR